MEQMYLLEIFIDKVTIFASEDSENSGAKKKLIIKVKFGPKVQFIIKEGQLAPNKDEKDDIIECDEQGRRKWARSIRVGKSYLFPSYPDTLLMVLSKCPLEIEVWNDDENEVQIFVGIGSMYWDTDFFFMLKETKDAKRLHEPLTVKTITTLWAECCCAAAGEIAFILRLSALGESITTEFQQLMSDPNSFVFRTDKAPSMFQCKRIEGDDPNFCMLGSLYETTTLEDPDVIAGAKEKIEVCTEFGGCGFDGTGNSAISGSDGEAKKKKYPIDKIRMGDIRGPCGNTNCLLAQKVRKYIRTLEVYQKETAGKVVEFKVDATKKVCGACCCKDDRYHREECTDSKSTGNATMCKGCGGVTHIGDTCDDRKKKLLEAEKEGSTKEEQDVKGKNKTQVGYVLSAPDFKGAMFGQSFVVENMSENYNSLPTEISEANTSKHRPCHCGKALNSSEQLSFRQISGPDSSTANAPSSRTMGLNNASVYNANIIASKPKVPVYNCTDITEDKDCKCDPPKPAPPCKTFDCDCITEAANIAARKDHKPYCPSYKHKTNCPVTMMKEEEENKEENEDENEPLPYGLPPIQLGPCPVLGRPCTVPDGFARMYKVAVQPTLPPSFSTAGKVCCSKEFHRIKKALKEYMEHEKEDDYRCVNKFNVDTERKCCDKEQRLLSLMGKGCCGSHKMAKQETFKENQKCINKFNVDTESKCCDKEQRLVSLTGKGCCGSHKMAKQEKFKENQKCVNKFNVDTESKCCDKEQRLLCLMDKGCCGSHKMAKQEKFKENQKCVNKFYVDTESKCCDKEQRLLCLMDKGCCGSHKMAKQKLKENKK